MSAMTSYLLVTYAVCMASAIDSAFVLSPSLRQSPRMGRHSPVAAGFHDRSAQLRCPVQPHQPHHTRISMAAEEVYQTVQEEMNVLQKVLIKLPPTVARATLWSLVGLSGVAGYVGTPSRRPWASGVGAVLVMSLTNSLREKLADQLKMSAASVVAGDLATKGVAGLTPDAVASIGDQYGMDESAWKAQLAELYKKTLLDMLTLPEITTAQLSELLKLQRLFSLSPSDTGDAHIEVSKIIYSYNRAYLEEDGENKAKQTRNKLLFLSDRVFAKDPSPEGYRYDMQRLCHVFSIDPKSYPAQIESSSVPFYQKALSVVITDPSKMTAANLLKAQSSLGVSGATANDLHVAAFTEYLTGMIANAPDGIKFGPAESGALDSLQKTFGLDDADCKTLVEQLVVPQYTSTVSSNLDLLLESGPPPAALIANLAIRQQELTLSNAAAERVETQCISGKAISLYRECCNFLNVQNLEKSMGAMDELLRYTDAVVALLQAGKEEGAEEDAIIQKYLSGIAMASSRGTESRQLYSLALGRALEQQTVSDEDKVLLKKLQVMLGVSDEESLKLFQSATGPIYKKAIMDAVATDDFSEAQVTKLAALVAQLALPDAMTSPMCADLYRERLGVYSEGEKIMTAEQAGTLKKMQKFMALDQEIVDGIHEKVSAPIYRNAVNEALGTTGVILSDYWDGLDKLKERLNLSDEGAQNLFNQVSGERMEELGKKAVAVLEEQMRQAQGGAPRTASASNDAGEEEGGEPDNRPAWQKRIDDADGVKRTANGTPIRKDGPIGSNDGGGAPQVEGDSRPQFDKPPPTPKGDFESGESMGIQAKVTVTEELMSLVDFCETNKLIVDAAPQATGAAALAAAAMPGEKKYLVTLDGKVALKARSALYRQYLIECFDANDQEQKQRLFMNLDKVAGVMGLPKDEVMKVNSELGTIIYEQYAKPALAKGPLSQEDEAFLTSIARTLEMPADLCEELIADQKKDRVGKLLERVFRSGTGTAADSRAMREAAEELDVDILKQLDISKPKQKKLFQLEIEDAISSGSDEGDIADLIAELVEGLKMEKPEAEAVMAESMEKRSSGHLLNAAAAVRRGGQEEAITEIENLLRFARLSGTEVKSQQVNLGEKQELYILYNAKCLTEGGIDEDKQADLTLLKATLGFEGKTGGD